MYYEIAIQIVLSCASTVNLIQFIPKFLRLPVSISLEFRGIAVLNEVSLIKSQNQRPFT